MSLTRRTFFHVALAAAAGSCAGGPGRASGYVVFGRQGTRDGEFLRPRAIFASPAELYVIDTTGRVQAFDHAGNFLRVFSTLDAANGTPTGVILNRAGRLVTADTHYSRVLEYTLEGKLVRSFGTHGTGPENFIYPTGIAQGPDGLYYVSEYGEAVERVHVFDAEGRYVRQWGSFGAGPGQFDRPMGIVVDGAGLVHVADTVNHRVQVFTPDGGLVRIIGELGEAPGKLKFPYNLAIAGDGTILLAEYATNRVSRFEPDGRFVACYGAAGRGPGEFAEPRGVAAAGRVAFVADTLNHRVQRFELGSA